MMLGSSREAILDWGRREIGGMPLRTILIAPRRILLVFFACFLTFKHRAALSILDLCHPQPTVTLPKNFPHKTRLILRKTIVEINQPISRVIAFMDLNNTNDVGKICQQNLKTALIRIMIAAGNVKIRRSWKKCNYLEKTETLGVVSVHFMTS